MSETAEQKVAAARARMAEIALKFIERSRGELDVIRERLAALGNGDQAALDDIRNLAHRMCGTGATLGFESLAEQAHKVERLCVALAAGDAPDAATLAGAAREIEALAGEVARLVPRGA